MNLSANL